MVCCADAAPNVQPADGPDPRKLHRVPAAPLAIVFQGNGGTINIPMDDFLWPQKPIKPERVFELSPKRLRYISRRADRLWIERARHRAFWQCRACGWNPIDNETWAWFSSLHWKSRAVLVEISKGIDRFEREIRSCKRDPSTGGRVMEPNCR